MPAQTEPKEFMSSFKHCNRTVVIKDHTRLLEAFGEGESVSVICPCCKKDLPIKSIKFDGQNQEVLINAL
jgi:hypothetical protein